MLRIASLELRNFRSYESFSLDGLDRLTILVGPNASGKTNAIESINLLTAQSSFRNPTPDELIGRHGDTASASVRIEGEGRVLDMGMLVEQGRRKWRLNGKAKSAKEVRGILPSVVFTPDDLQVVKGPDKLRRRELDAIGSQLNSNYDQILHDYGKLLTHRNRLLKDGADDTMLEAIDDVFVIVAEQLSDYREALFGRVLPIQGSHYGRLSASSETLSGSYRRSWEGDLRQALRDSREDERMRKRTLAGPHLDRISFEIDGLDASMYASQGQQRSVMLSLKLAEVDLIEEMKGASPVLLLDDVMSELDETRRSALVGLVSKGSQTFVTTANMDYFDDGMISEARIVELSK